MNCFILTGPIQSGKTTELMDEFSGHLNIGGFFSPVLNGKRHFQHTESGVLVPMENPENDLDAMPVGRFQFSKSAFEKAKEWFWADLKSEYKQMLIMDEIGPLELRDEGFADLISAWLNDGSPSEKVLLAVVREDLPDKILEHWPALKSISTVISKKELPLVWHSIQ